MPYPVGSDENGGERRTHRSRTSWDRHTMAEGIRSHFDQKEGPYQPNIPAPRATRPFLSKAFKQGHVPEPCSWVVSESSGQARKRPHHLSFDACDGYVCSRCNAMRHGPALVVDLYRLVRRGISTGGGLEIGHSRRLSTRLNISSEWYILGSK